MITGVAYYPEHWPRERWAEDARLMREAGINTARLAEFAWGRIEVEEGRFDFSWLDDAIAVLAKEDIRVVLGTPTETMPPWLAKRYPEALAMDAQGVRQAYGTRRNNCPTSARYRSLGAKYVEAMAQQYAGHSQVVAWQVDNEFSGPFCFCELCEAEWQKYLASKFASIDDLNERWGTSFWSHTYRSFDEVSLPRGGAGNPGLLLEFRRFHSRQIVSFQHEQVLILRRLCPGVLVTHNMCGFFLDEIDYYDLARELDVAGLDYYYNNGPWPGRLHGACYEAAAMDLTRSLKKQNFWVMETPSGPIGSEYFLRNLRPLEMRRMNWQAVAHGADAMFWFRWRSCLAGQEQFSHGVLGHDGVPGRRYEDLRRVIGEMQNLAPALSESVVRSPVAVIYAYENRWAFGIQPNAKGFDYFGHLFQYHRALKREGLDVDFVNVDESVDSYKLVVLPAGFILSAAQAERLSAFVERGGVLITTARTSVKDEDNRVHPSTLPGLLRKVCGIRIDEYEALCDPEKVRLAPALGEGAVDVTHFADWILSEGAEVLGTYESAYLESFAAVTRNRFGKGSAYYVGTCFADDEPVRAVVRAAMKDADVRPLVVPPPGVDISLRQTAKDCFLFLMNHNDDAVTIDCATLPACEELLVKRAAKPSLSLPGGEVAVLRFAR